MSPTSWTASARVRTSARGSRLLIEITGDFDIRLGLQVWKSCRSALGMYRAIIFDLSKIGRMEQSGLAWLVMFQRYTHSQKTRLTLVLGHWDIAEQCEQAGLNVAMLMSDTRSGLANAHPTAPNGGANHGTTGSVPAGSRC